MCIVALPLPLGCVFLGPRPVRVEHPCSGFAPPMGPSHTLCRPLPLTPGGNMGSQCSVTCRLQCQLATAGGGNTFGSTVDVGVQLVPQLARVWRAIVATPHHRAVIWWSEVANDTGWIPRGRWQQQPPLLTVTTAHAAAWASRRLATARAFPPSHGVRLA